MIYCLTGELILLDALSGVAVVDCGGVGYKASVTSNTVTKLSGLLNKSVRIYTHMQIREDAVELYGFYGTDEAEAFRLLITVSGVGPKAAMAILSVMTPESLSSAIACEDSKAISKAQGVGSKTAARIVLELREKFQKAFPVAAGDSASPKSGKASASVGGSSLSDARDALIVLGYSQAEATAALRGIDSDGTTEELIRRALANLMK